MDGWMDGHACMHSCTCMRKCVCTYKHVLVCPSACLSAGRCSCVVVVCLFICMLVCLRVFVSCVCVGLFLTVYMIEPRVPYFGIGLVFPCFFT